MIDQNTINICNLIKQAFARVKRNIFISDTTVQELAIAFTFLRRIDCLIGEYADDCYMFFSENKDKLSDKQLKKKLIEISGNHNFYNVSSYNFEGFLRSGLSVDVALNSYLQGFSSNVRYILSDMNFEQSVAVLQRKSKYLVELFEFYSELDFSISALSNNSFIDLITILVSDVSKNVGLYPTPIGLSKLICDCLFCKEVCEGLTYDDPLEEISIYDPVCGTGSLLAYAGEKAKCLRDNKEDVYLIGQEISTFQCAIAYALVLLTGDKNSFANDVNTLTEEDSDGTDYKFVVGDLPLGLPWTPIRERVVRENMKGNGRFNKGLPSTSDSQFLFIQDIVSKMDCMGGRAAFITSASVLQGGSVKSGESRIRRWLFESGLVETIIALPAGTLSPYSNIPVYLWILSCNESLYGNEYWEKMDGKVRLIDTTKLISSQKQFKLDDDFISSVLSEYKSLENTNATQIIKKEAFGFYEVTLLENGKKKETVIISLDTDIKEFVENERKPYAKGEITIDFASVEKGYIVDFSKFFKPEEGQVSSLKEDSLGLLSIIDDISSLKLDVEKLANAKKIISVSKTWREIPLRAATDIIQSSNKSHVVDKNGLPYISVASLRGDSSDDTLYAITPQSKRVYSSDVIVIKVGGNAGEILRGADGLLSPTLAALRCSDETIIAPQYLYYLLKGYEKSFKSMTNSTTIKSISPRAILEFKCLIPPVNEQIKIASYLDDLVGRIDKIIVSLNSSDNVFTQYRQAIIENIVKGKIQI